MLFTAVSFCLVAQGSWCSFIEFPLGSLSTKTLCVNPLHALCKPCKPYKPYKLHKPYKLYKPDKPPFWEALLWLIGGILAALQPGGTAAAAVVAEPSDYLAPWQIPDLAKSCASKRYLYPSAMFFGKRPTKPAESTRHISGQR